MFASYEVATSFPSLTAIKGYDLDKSADVPLMGHINTYNIQTCFQIEGPGSRPGLPGTRGRFLPVTLEASR